MKKKENYFSGNYKRCLEFLKESKNFIYFSVIVFFVFFLIGYFFPVFFRNEIIKIIEELSKKVIGKNAIELINMIFWNNLKACVICVVFGVFLGITPFLIAVYNGYAAGFVSGMAVQKAESIFVLLRLLPHGIFELPAVFISIGLGLKLAVNLFSKNSGEKLKRNLKEILRFMVFVIIPLLLIAAIIEGFLIFMIK